MKRREFIALVGGAALASRAQERKVIRIGMMGASLLSAPPIAKFRHFIASLAEHCRSSRPRRVTLATSILLRANAVIE